MDFNSFVLKKGTDIYRGSNSEDGTIKDNITWFALSFDDAKNYGKYVFKYTVTNDVKLIDIMDANFHSNYQNTLNYIYNGPLCTAYSAYEQHRLR